MMGRKQILKNGWEDDLVRGKSYSCIGRASKRYIKRKLNKRYRKDMKNKIKNGWYE